MHAYIYLKGRNGEREVRKVRARDREIDLIYLFTFQMPTMAEIGSGQLLDAVTPS